MIAFLRKRAMLAILFLTCGMVSSFADPQGSGTASDPYLIGSAEELVWFRDYVNSPHYTACAKLTDDIDLKDVCHPASDGVEEVSWVPIGSFNGTFDGDGKKIKNFYYSDNNAKDYNRGAFFKYLEGTIKDLSFTDATIIGTDGAYAVVAAEAFNATINNITIESGNISKTGTSGSTRQNCGSIIGCAKQCDINNCTNRINIESSRNNNGGICGEAGSCTITNCRNFGNITGTYAVGGLIGIVNSRNYTPTLVLKNSANYGDIVSTNQNGTDIAVGGIIGEIYSTELTLENIFNTGNVTCNAPYAVPGFIIGNTDNNTVISTGYIVYNNSCTIKKQDVTQSSVAVGKGVVNGVYSFQDKDIKAGLVAALFQQNSTDGSVWGQQLGTDEYPVLGSSYRVYTTKDIQVSCLGNIINTDATFTNTEFETVGTITISHCDTPTHHEAVAATCTVAGNVEYYECTFCHKYFSNIDLTDEIESPIITALGHDYVDNVCTRCNDKVATDVLKKGISSIYIKAVDEDRSKIGGYNIYKFVAPNDGTLTVYTTGNEDTYGTLWNSTQTEQLKYNDDSGEGYNFKFSYEVTKGTVYYIGVRQLGGNEIGYYTITIEGTWSDIIEELTITDKEATDFSTECPVANLTYKRTFNNTNWQPLYIPFAMASADWKDKGLEVACINNFHEYNTTEGKKVVLEVNKVTAGVLHPNTPYLIRATEEGEKTITLTDATVMTKENTFTCSSMTRNYHFKGVYSEKSDLDAENDYILSGGKLMNMSEDAALSPQRWYVSVENRGSLLDAEETTAQARTITIEVVGETGATGIEQIGVIEEDVETIDSGIYDLQGRRLNNAPAKGVFIVNGKKYIK